MGSDASTTSGADATKIKIQAPPKLLGPITKKIMLEPVMVLSSMKVYEKTTIQKWLKTGRNYDPLTGIPLSIAGIPLLLVTRHDIKTRIDDFIQQYPSTSSDQFNKKMLFEWDQLFRILEFHVKKKHEMIVQNQNDLKAKPQHLFSRDDEKNPNSTISYQESIMLRSDIPVICFMGPARSGKSTIINDILGVKNACKTSSRNNINCTKGAWITLYSKLLNQNNNNGNALVTDTIDDNDVKNNNNDNDRKQEFYLLDMQGLSLSVTKFTKRIFYACYATSNVIVWNDKNVMHDEFQNLMQELKKEMKVVSKSDKKPSFIYLKRDAGDYCNDPYDTFDDYINKDKSFEWFRDMNIFSSINGYELDRPMRNAQNKQCPLNFTDLSQNRVLLTPFIKELVLLSQTSNRFAVNRFVLKQQITYINSSASLSLTGKLITDDPILQLFMIAPKDSELHRRDMIYVASQFLWDHNQLEIKYEKAINDLKKLQTVVHIDKKIINSLDVTKQEIYERIKNKTTNNDNKGSTWGGYTATAVFGICVLASVPFPQMAAASIFAGGFGFLSGTTVQKSQQFITYMFGDYTLKYSLGPTDAELKLDKQKPNRKTKYSQWSLPKNG